ncbi:Predicted nucleic acid-binding protein, contains PIN domain [Nonomuraea solani]|uniref:Predicted nucleic acid-binding protein, contains PIN domain n=1 Tax=Nonomuraea solani TaxID=1144553 RepID=A0A1H6DZJ7_9ACTN|nr:type II toxin-antitoxin system VapC family toxin [Nonomuraea solani]SEG90621.1 Predicted nucleic acid-binding protein, contains PIN domain [Nonomuraea solani]
MTKRTRDAHVQAWLGTGSGLYVSVMVFGEIRKGAVVAEEWGRLHAVRPLPIIDGLIAATARTHDWTLATRNVKDFAGLDVKTVNPSEGRPPDDKTVVNPFGWPTA